MAKTFDDSVLRDSIAQHRLLKKYQTGGILERQTVCFSSKSTLCRGIGGMIVIRVVSLDDHPLFRQGVRLFLETIPDITMVGELDDGRELLAFLVEHPADVLLLDLQMPSMDGLSVLEELQKKPDPPKVLVLTSFGGWERVHKALQLGAAGYVMKDAPPQELLAAIQAAAAGGTYLSAAATTEMMSHLGPGRMAGCSSDELIEPLTQREEEVLGYIVKGCGNKEIAAALFLTEATVKTHVANILQKIGVKSRTQAALWAMGRRSFNEGGDSGGRST